MQQRITEQRNSKSLNIDTMSTKEIVKLINHEDQQVPIIIGQPAVQNAIATIIDQIVRSLQNNGRLFYLGAGTSGRLGILDAAECVPTFGSDPEMIQGLIAGGPSALIKAVEGAEDSTELGATDLKKHHLTKRDFVLGIAASGRTPYVIGGLDYANSLGCPTGALSCNNNAVVSQHATYAIEAVVGPEVVTGSTRMKAGTAQKLILNTVSTAAMIKLGKVYSNLMVDVQPTNLKLVDRAKRIIQAATGVDYETASQFYNEADGQPKIAIVMINGRIDRDQAENILNANNGFIARALDNLTIN